jgi:uncharacterized protein YbjT (DUF2867 family)
MKLLLVGATGLVGSHVLRLALDNEAIERVIAPVRRKLSPHRKLHAPIVDFENLPTEESWWNVDAVICTLGTTRRTAGSKERFHRVDHDYPIMVARIAKSRGVPAFALNSAIGADPNSRFFYNRTKGILERDLKELGFESLIFVRPGLIGGDRKEFRLGEKAGELFLKLLGPLLPQAWRINPAHRIANALLDSAIEAKPGIHMVGSRELI